MSLHQMESVTEHSSGQSAKRTETFKKIAEAYYNYMVMIDLKIADLIKNRDIVNGNLNGIFMNYRTAEEYKESVSKKHAMYKEEILQGIMSQMLMAPILIDYTFCIQLSSGEVENMNIIETKDSIITERYANVRAGRDEEAIPRAVLWKDGDKVARRFDVGELHSETVVNFISVVVIPALTVGLLRQDQKRFSNIFSYTLQYEY